MKLSVCRRAEDCLQVRKPVDGVDVRRRSGCVFELVSGKQLKVNFWDRACMELGNVIRVSEINGRVLKRSLLLELAVALAFCECDVRKMMVTEEKAQLQQGTSPSCIFLSDSVSIKAKGKRSCTTKPLSPPSQHRKERDGRLVISGLRKMMEHGSAGDPASTWP